MLQQQYIDWQNEHKNKTCICALYKRLNSAFRTYIYLEEGDGKDILFKQKSKESWSTNTHSGQIDFKIKTVLRGRKDSAPGGSAGKEPTCSAGDPGLIPVSGRFPGEGIGYPCQYSWVSLVAQLAKNPPTMWGTWIRSLG